MRPRRFKPVVPVNNAAHLAMIDDEIRIGARLSFQQHTVLQVAGEKGFAVLLSSDWSCVVNRMIRICVRARRDAGMVNQLRSDEREFARMLVHVGFVQQLFDTRRIRTYRQDGVVAVTEHILRPGTIWAQSFPTGKLL